MYLALVRLRLKPFVLFWASHDKKDMEVLEQAQSRAMELVKCPEHRSDEEQLGVFGTEERRLRGDVIVLYLKGGARWGSSCSPK